MDMVGVLDAVVELLLVRGRGHTRGVKFVFNWVGFPATKDVSQECELLFVLRRGRYRLGATHQDVLDGITDPSVMTVAKLYDPHLVVRVTGMASVTASDIEMVKVVTGEIGVLCQPFRKFSPHDSRIGFLLSMEIIHKGLAPVFGERRVSIDLRHSEA